LDEVSGKTVKELNLFYDSEQIKKLLARSNGKDSVKGELTIRSKSGERIVCLFSFEQIKIQNNEYMLVAATNITQRKQMEERLKKLGNQQKLLANIAQLLNKSDNFDDIINVVLRLIGEHTNVSRVSIYENTPDEQFTTNTFEWCNEGIAGKKEALQRVSFENTPSWIKIINTEGHLSSADIIELPQDIASVFNLFGIKSILLYPLYIQNRLWGFVGLDDCLHNRVWLEEEISLLKTVTGNIANALERKLYLNQFQNSEMRLRLALDGAREGM
jgi:transcriptional regulator with GAF, ATPase, and Fis domain